MKYVVQYQIGTYAGRKEVFAENKEDALVKVKIWARREMVAGIYSDSYKVISQRECYHEIDDE